MLDVAIVLVICTHLSFIRRLALRLDMLRSEYVIFFPSRRMSALMFAGITSRLALASTVDVSLMTICRNSAFDASDILSLVASGSNLEPAL